MLDPTSSVWISNLLVALLKQIRESFPVRVLGHFKCFSQMNVPSQTGSSRACHVCAFVQAASKPVRIVAWLPSHLPLSLWCHIFVLVTLTDAIWLPSFLSFHCSQLPSLQPSVMSHSFSLLSFLLSLTPPPAVCHFCVIFFPLKLFLPMLK